MRKIASTVILGLISICGYAQYDEFKIFRDDALRASENEYEGTARTLAMGNAFTALGGDLGSIGLNPAGSAVAGYSQMTLTPALSIVSSTSKGILPDGNPNAPYFERELKKSAADFSLSNIGITFNYKTGRTSGLKNVTVGFVTNKTAGWNEDSYANGTNNKTSFMGYIADRSYGWTVPEMSYEDAFHDNPYVSDWKPILGYQSGMTWDYDTDKYIGGNQMITEDSQGNMEIIVPGTLDQSFGRRVEGGKYDYVFNVGANISDFVYIGANFGITTLEYSYREYFKEKAVDPYEFRLPLQDESGNESTLYFKDMTYSYSQNDSGVGYYGKFGVIVTPGGGFRIGAAIQTPTVTKISTEFSMRGAASYIGEDFAPVETPEGYDNYTVVSPFRANFGLAYTFGRFGVISADYEMCDYGSMSYKTYDDAWGDYENINDDIRSNFRLSHMFRIGAEIKPFEELAIRAGYGFTTDPDEYVYREGLSMMKYQNISFGLGYSSKGSFFADLALRRTFLPNESTMPYEDYVLIQNNEGEWEPDPDFYAPEILYKKSLWKVLLTIGWRF